MDLPETVFAKFKTKLISMDYPLIKYMNDADIRAIFLPKSRVNFLIWIFSQLNPTDTDFKYSNVEVAKPVLASLLLEYGFCYEKERFDFIDCVDLQCHLSGHLEIFKRIFLKLSGTHPETVLERDDSSRMLKSALSGDPLALQEILGYKPSIFTFGMPAKLTQQQQKQKIIQYEQRNNDLKETLDKNNFAAEEITTKEEPKMFVHIASESLVILDEIPNNLSDSLKQISSMKGLSEDVQLSQISFHIQQLQTPILSVSQTFQDIGNLENQYQQVRKSTQKAQVIITSNDHQYPFDVLEKQFDLINDI